MKAWRRGVVVLLWAAWLAGCGGDEDKPPPDERLGGVAQPAAPEEEAPAAPSVAPFDEAVAIEMSARLRSDRRLMVEGTTNLPEATRLQVLVEREVSGVRWQQRTRVAGGGFEAGPFGPGSGLPDGGYRLTVNMPAASVQPPEVRARLGEEGQHLRGPLVRPSRHGLGRVVRAQQRVLVGSQPRQTKDQVEVMELE
ncbi:hypothetical protein [Halomonas koreensis]|uniref:Lipoprotein n=1 Tax=Halomonas koreensis TaxID=245385 RepID=A0ABU1G4W0_9GAMM|nr:hypothetical protein [Halomonas koreensis]MDR5867548.1 hypothetical protein [Halomonas koreensis]